MYESTCSFPWPRIKQKIETRQRHLRFGGDKELPWLLKLETLLSPVLVVTIEIIAISRKFFWRVLQTRDKKHLQQIDVNVSEEG